MVGWLVWLAGGSPLSWGYPWKNWVFKTRKNRKIRKKSNKKSKKLEKNLTKKSKKIQQKN